MIFDENMAENLLKRQKNFLPEKAGIYNLQVLMKCSGFINISGTAVQNAQRWKLYQK
jgi:hypothetical protein